MAILWVYLPRYSITLLGPLKGRLANTTQSFLYNSFTSSLFISAGNLSLSNAINLPLKTLLMAFTENKYLPLVFAVFHFPCLVSPPPGTMQCKCGCKLSVCPQVCRMAIMPLWAPSHL